MMKLYELSKGIKIRLWVSELPEAIIGGSSSMNAQINVQCMNTWLNNKMAIEISLPKHNSNYGLLGIEFVPINSSTNLEIEVHYNKQNSELFRETLAYSKDTVYATLPEEYAETVLRKSMEFVHNNPNLPSGVLIFTVGAHCEIGSSKFLFGLITEILLNVMLINNRNYDSQEIEEIIDRLLIFR